MSEVKVNKLSPRSGTTVTIGDSGDTINIVGTLQNNGAPIPGDISSVVAGTGLSGGGTTGDVTLNIEAAQPTITSTGTLTSFTSTGIDDNATSTAITIDSSEHTHFGSTSSPSAGQGGVSILNYGTIQSSRTATGNLTHNEFYNPNGQVGNIKTSGSDLNINASSSLTFYTNNSEKMRVLSSGSVGIGTSNPAKKFHVYGSGSEIARFEATGGNSFIGLKDADDGTIAYIGADAGKLKFQTSGSGYSDKLLIDTAGNVGIGETAPLGLLHVKSADSGASVNSGHNQFVAENSGNSGMTILSGNTSNGAICFGDDGNNCIGYLNYTHNGDHLDFGVNGSEKMRIDSSGNVGIGTTNPIADLSIVDSTTSSGIEIQPELTTDTNRITNYDRGDNSYKNFRLDALTQQFLISGSECMRIDSAGRLLVGTTSPYSNNNAISIALNTTNSTSSPFPQGIVYRKLNFQGSNAVAVDFQDFAGNREGSIQFNESGTSFNTSSDYRLKENVNYDFDATTRLKQLKPARFNFIADADTTVDGFLAHEVSSIVPEAISGEKDAVNEDGSIQPQGIDQSKLVPLLVKTIQELEARITTLENA